MPTLKLTLNPKCAEIDQEIKELQADLKTAPPSHKAAIMAQIRQAKIRLAACKKKHPK
jgi:hypothetical protein